MSPASLDRIDRPVLEKFSLENGLRVVLAPIPASPTASVWVWYRVGSKNERPGITGASHWVEHMLFKGSPRYAKGEIDRAIVGVGGELNAFTDTDFTAYFSTVPREHLDIPLDIESDRMTRASITDEEVERERTVIHSEREGNENWPEFKVEEVLFQLAIRIHPYRWDALGHREDIVRMTPGELRTYYRRFYGPRNAVLVVAGGFNSRTIMPEIRSRFGALPATGDDVTVPEIEPPAQGERRTELSGPGTMPLVQIGWRCPALFDPVTPATMVLDTLLGGETRLFSAGAGWWRSTEHPSARLYRALVDTGLAVRATSEFRPKFYPSLFMVQALAADGVSLDRLEREVERTLERVARSGPTRSELDDIRTKVRRGAALAYEGASRCGFRLGFFSTIRSPSYEDELLRAVLRVTVKEVRDQARQLFESGHRVVVRYTPSGGGDGD